jgi:hypothetical protein
VRSQAATRSLSLEAVSSEVEHNEAASVQIADQEAAAEAQGMGDGESAA